MRAFVAIEMPDPVLRQILNGQRRMMQQLRTQQLERLVRWTPADNLHLTLRFLGEIDEEQRSQLEQSLARVAQKHPTITLFADGVGCFPNARRPNVIWCGIDGDLPALQRLQAEVERAACAVGLAAEEKPFKAHLTIGRLQRNAHSSQLQAVGASVTHLDATTPKTERPVSALIQEVRLVRSELTPSGPLYTPLGVFPLSGATPA